MVSLLSGAGGLKYRTKQALVVNCRLALTQGEWIEIG